MYSRQNESLGKMYKFQQNKSNQCKNITRLGFAKQPSNYQPERQPIPSTRYKYNYRWQQILNGMNIGMSVNRVPTILGLVSMVIED